MKRHASVLATTQRSRVHTAAAAGSEEEGDDEAEEESLLVLLLLLGLAAAFAFGSVQPPRIKPVDSTLEKRYGLIAESQSSKFDFPASWYKAFAGGNRWVEMEREGDGDGEWDGDWEGEGGVIESLLLEIGEIKCDDIEEECHLKPVCRLCVLRIFTWVVGMETEKESE